LIASQGQERDKQKVIPPLFFIKTLKRQTFHKNHQKTFNTASDKALSL
jgi:hypothetical protein